MKVAVVTGASSGIGRDVAVGLARAGYRVALGGRREDALRETAKLAGPDEALPVRTDVRSQQSVQELFGRAMAEWGRVDLLFNNAGSFGGGGPFEEVPLDQWNQAIETNLTGSFLCAQAAFRIMKGQDPQGGRIINNGSLSAHVPRPFAVGYTASKHAITGLTDMPGPRAPGVPQADGSVRAEPRMEARHVTDAVLMMAALPLDANVQFLTVMATNMPYIGRG